MNQSTSAEPAEAANMDLHLDGKQVVIPQSKWGVAQIDYTNPISQLDIKSSYPLLIGILRNYNTNCSAELISAEGTFSKDVDLHPGDRLSLLYGSNLVSIDIIAPPKTSTIHDYHNLLEEWSTFGARQIDDELFQASNEYLEQEYHAHNESQKQDSHLREVLQKLNASEYPFLLMHRDKPRYELYKKLLQMVAEERSLPDHQF